MAQHSLNYDVVQRSGAREDETDRKGLGYEKLGVIAGFLIGLPVPQWLGIVATVIVVSVFTSLGLRAGMALAKRISRGNA